MATSLLGCYILATSKVILGREATCDSAHSRRLYSAAALGVQATSTMTQNPNQLPYPGTGLTWPCPILVMLSAGLGSNEYLNNWVDSTGFRTFEPALYRCRAHNRLLTTTQLGRGSNVVNEEKGVAE